MIKLALRNLRRYGRRTGIASAVFALSSGLAFFILILTTSMYVKVAVLKFPEVFVKLRPYYIPILSIPMIGSSLAVLVTMMLAVLERRREIGVMLAVGWSRLDVTKLVLLEASLIGLIGSLLGCLAGLLMAHVFVNWVFTTVIIPLSAVNLIAQFLAVSIGLGLLSGLYPAYISSTTEIIEALRG